ncbi:acetyltransferase [Siminovitchia fordii]|uniref:acetyltransferase n=1 Tax=Siminovitchia fordii TaxID=254759 RepID=UPI000368DD8C|nr:acetyltransferase [Siminovitchia fordii]
MKKIVIVGQGGHSKVIKDIIIASKEYQIYALLDDKYDKPTQKDKIIYAPISYANVLCSEKEIYFNIAIGDNSVRKKVGKMLDDIGVQFAILKHPTAVISPSVEIGRGSVIMPNCVVNADTVIGEHVIINSSSVIEHDNQINGYVHISPKAVLTGNVYVGEGTQIGAGATVIPNIKIGDWSMVGAGATVVSDIPSKVTVVGVPAKIIT